MRNQLIILTISIVGSLTSCRTSESITNSATMVNKYDSVVIHEIVKVDTIRIPADSVIVQVPIVQLEHDTIIKYRSRSASVKMEVDHGQLRVTANCDSLERLVLSYEKLNTNYHRNVARKTHSEKLSVIQRVPWFYRASLWILIILLVVGAIGLVIKLYLKTSLL